MIPESFEFALLFLAAFRIWKLVGDDAILDRPRAWAIEKIGGPDSDRGTYWGAFIMCPWCAGFWIVLLWWGSWLVFPTETIFVSVPWALSAIVGLIGSKLVD